MILIRSFLFIAFFVHISTAITGCQRFSVINSSPKILRTNFVNFKSQAPLDPSSLSFAQQYFVLDNMTIKLVGIGEQDQYVNELAENIEFSEDKKTISIKLKKLKFSDGSHIKAIDVAKSLKRAAILGSPHTNIEDLWLGAEKLKNIEDDIPGILVLDDFNLKLRLTREAKEILYFLSMADLGILHHSQYTKNKLTVKDWTSVTSGPFKGDLDPSENIFLVKNKHYSLATVTYPDQVLFNNQHGKNFPTAAKKSLIDLGFVTFNDFLENEKMLTQEDYSIMGEQFDALCFLVLNAKSKKFSDPKLRRTFQKKIHENFKIDEPMKKAARKASQFFLPDAMGFVDEKKVYSKINALSAPSTEFKKLMKDGLVIDGIEGMRNYLPSNIQESISKALDKIDVKLKLDTPNEKLSERFKVKRDFDSYIIAVGMSKKVLGEALNLQYLSDPPFLTDPTGKIKRLLKKYQNEEAIRKEGSIISEIIMQMIEDSELIPLFYFSAPFIINNKTIISTKLNLRESVKFSKIQLK